MFITLLNHKRHLIIVIILVASFPVLFYYHNENRQDGQAVPLGHGGGHVGIELRVVVHHVQLQRRRSL